MVDFVDVFSRIHGRLPGSSALPATARWLASQEPPVPLGEVHARLETLRAKGWIETHKGQTDNDYAGLVVEPASRSLLESIHALVKAIPGRSWAAAFHGDRPVLLDTLHHTDSVVEAARICGLAKSTAYDAAARMHEEATLVRHGAQYRLNDRIAALHPAIHEVARLATQRRITVGWTDPTEPPPFDILWHQGPEALIAADADLPGIALGGLDAFASFGLDFATRRRTYFVSKRDLDASDALLQAILANPSSAQVRAYAGLLYEKERPDTLIGRAGWYGLPQEAVRIREYVDNRVDVPGFLPQGEYRRLQTLYGVTA